MRALFSMSLYHSKEQKLLYTSSLSNQYWNTPFCPGGRTSPAPIWALFKEPKMHPVDSLRAALNLPPSSLGDSGAPSYGAHRYAGVEVFPCSQCGRTPLQPPPPSHSDEEKPAVHFPPLQASLPPTPLDCSQKTWIHQHSVSRLLDQLSVGPPPLISPTEASLPRADRAHLMLEIWTPLRYPVLWAQALFQHWRYLSLVPGPFRVYRSPLPGVHQRRSCPSVARHYIPYSWPKLIKLSPQK